MSEQKKYDKQYFLDLAARIYDLDVDVYETLGSSLGRVFGADRDRCVAELASLMRDVKGESEVRNSLALIGNMARTLPDGDDHFRLLTEYNAVLHELSQLPSGLASTDILDEKNARLNELHLENRFQPGQKLIICISRSCGAGASDIGFMLADRLKVDYYDAEIFAAVIRRLEAEQDGVADLFGGSAKQAGSIFERVRQRTTLREKLRQISRYHGLPARDAVFFSQSGLICDMAKRQDFVVMGRCADVVLANARVPHISIFITAPEDLRSRRVMAVNHIDEKKARAMIRRVDRVHAAYYRFYTGRKWGAAENYDLCFNSANYGIQGSIDFIMNTLRLDRFREEKRSAE